jgi:CheY-like chemotaxis protein
MKKINCILLVDDDNINNFINERLLKKLNITNNVKVAMNGEEALDFIKNNKEEIHPELILLDINMPVMDGFEFLQEYNKVDFNGKLKPHIIMLTTSTNPNDVNKVKQSDITGYINKPLTESKIMEIVQKHFPS